jgi:hypothetical protein
VPDISFAGYLAGPLVGAASYNGAHSYIGPIVFAATVLNAEAALTLSLVWGDHIGLDCVLR